MNYIHNGLIVQQSDLLNRMTTPQKIDADSKNIAAVAIYDYNTIYCVSSNADGVLSYWRWDATAWTSVILQDMLPSIGLRSETELLRSLHEE